MVFPPMAKFHLYSFAFMPFNVILDLFPAMDLHSSKARQSIRL